MNHPDPDFPVSFSPDVELEQVRAARGFAQVLEAMSRYRDVVPPAVSG